MSIDADIEDFYLIFKDSMLNFYVEHTFSRPIKLWSNILNEYKKKQEYDNIQKKIVEIISLFAIDLMKVTDNYKIGILVTNIKRWNKLTDKHKIYFDNVNKNVVFLLLDIYSYLMIKIEKEDLKMLFQQVELYLLYYDFSELIKYSVNNNKLAIIDKLQKFDIYILEQIIEIYDLDIDKNIPISSRKLFKIINNI